MIRICNKYLLIVFIIMDIFGGGVIVFVVNIYFVIEFKDVWM